MIGNQVQFLDDPVTVNRELSEDAIGQLLRFCEPQSV